VRSSSSGRRSCRELQFALVVTSAFCLLTSDFGWAGHPFITDDAGTQGAGNWQLELMAQRDRNEAIADTGGGAVRQRAAFSLLNPVLTYGLFDTVDLALGLNYLRGDVSEGGVIVERVSGMSDSTLELKWRFYDADNVSFALKPGITLPTGDEDRGLGTGRVGWGINLIGDYDVKPWAWFANLAYFHPRFQTAQAAADSRAHVWRISAGTTYAVRENVWLAGELGVRTNEARNDPFLPESRARFAMVGVIYSPTKDIDLDVGLRKRVSGAETDTVLLVGATFRW
jgi:hypothetical protein